jgi:hypothetical protein
MADPVGSVRPVTQSHYSIQAEIRAPVGLSPVNLSRASLVREDFADAAAPAAIENVDRAGDSVRISLAAMVKELDSLGMGVAAIALSLGIDESAVREYLGLA